VDLRPGLLVAVELLSAAPWRRVLRHTSYDIRNPNQVTIFAYLTGAMMAAGVVAPAKRMSFFIRRNTDYSPQGL
jgi:hypothetical protein